MSSKDVKSFPKTVRALLIGVDFYHDSTLVNLTQAVRQTEQLGQILTSFEGCRVLPENVTLLAQPEKTTRKGIERSIQKFSDSCLPNDIVFFYFAGHGLVQHNKFALSANDTYTEQIDETAITSLVLANLFSSCRARGMIFLLDCCNASGLVEKAPEFLTRLGDTRDFRIVLSASGLNQSAWEVSGEGSLFAEFLLKALKGEMNGIGHYGEIYFQELFDYLQENIQAAQKQRYPDLPVQEIAFSGFYKKNPLLFVNSDVTLANIELQTARYSKVELRRRVKISVAFVAALVVGGAGSYWMWMDQHRFFHLNSSGIAVFHGYPGLTGFGLPKMLFETGFSADELSEASPLGNEDSVVFSKHASTRLRFEEELSQTGIARLHYLDGDFDKAAAIVSTAANESLNGDAQRRAYMLLAASATSERTDELMVLENHAHPDVNISALKGLARVDRKVAIAAAIDRGFGQYDLHFDLMRVFRAPCDDSLAMYLSQFASHPNFDQFARYTADVYLRTDCELPEAVFNTRHLVNRQAVTRSFLISGAMSSEGIVERYRSMVTDDSFNGGFDHAIEGLSSLPVVPCLAEDSVFSQVPQTSYLPTLIKFSMLLAKSCGNVQVAAEVAKADGRSIVRVVTFDSKAKVILVQSEHFLDGTAGDVVPVIEWVESLKPTTGINILKAVIENASDSTAVANAMSVLRSFGAAPPDLEEFIQSTSVDIRLEALRWLAMFDVEEVLRYVIELLTLSDNRFIPFFVQELDLNSNQKNRILLAAGAPAVDSRMQSLIYAVLGDSDRLREMLNSPIYSERIAAYEAIGAIENLDDVRVGEIAPDTIPTKMETFISNSERARELLEHQLTDLPKWAVAWRADQLLSFQLGGSDVFDTSVFSAGDRLYAVNLVRSLGGDVATMSYD